MEKNDFNGGFRINYDLLGKVIAEKYKRGNVKRYYFNYFCKKNAVYLHFKSVTGLLNLLTLQKKQLN